MKKILPLMFIPLLLISCNKVNYSSLIVGTFSQTEYAENELSSNPEEDAIVYGFCDTKKESKLIFNSDGTYSLNIVQHLDNITFDDEFAFSLEDLTKVFERDICISGTYSLNNNKIILSNDTVISEGVLYNFDDYQKIDPVVGNKVQTVKLAVSENELKLYYGKKSITYFRK